MKDPRSEQRTEIETAITGRPVARTEVAYLSLLVADDETPRVGPLDPGVDGPYPNLVRLRLTRGATVVVSRAYLLALYNAAGAELTRPEIENDRLTAEFDRIEASS